MGFIKRLVKSFIPPDIDALSQTRAKTLIYVLLFTLLLSLCMAPLTNALQSDFPYPIIIVGIILLLLLYKYTQSTLVVGNLTVLLIFVALAYSTFQSGGIYSHDLLGMFLVLTFAISVTNLKSTVGWAIVVILFISYHFFIAQDPDILKVYSGQRQRYPAGYYYAVNVISIIVPLIFLSILAYSNQSLIRSLKESNDKLDESNSKLESSNTRLEKYAHSASHDLRQPVRSIISFSQLLAMNLKKLGVNDDKSKEYLTQITDGAKRMNSMTQELLSYSLVSSDIVSTEHDVRVIIDEALVDLKSQIDSTSFSIEIGEMPEVLVLKSNLRQVFQNLISNAIKYKKPNTPLHLKISSKKQKGFWVFCVEDNGQGIAQESLENIFEFQTQEDHNADGQGIGLSTCHQIITGYKGKIWVDSELGKGSSFYFTFPDKDTVKE